jgi:hypothetical protein
MLFQTKTKNMKFFWIVIFPLLFWIGCEQPEAQKVFTGDKQFRTTDPSLLRFNNLRTVYYYRERPKNTKLDIYKLRKFTMTKEYPLLIPVIVHNWMEEEAYLFFENNLYPYFMDTVTVKWQSSLDSMNTEGVYELALRNKQNQYEFSGKLYESLQKGHDLFIKNSKNEFVPFYDNIDDKSAFNTTIRDYYRLTEVY